MTPVIGREERHDVVVVGAGLAGLTAGYLLGSDFDVVVLEAEPRSGGRAMTYRDVRGRDIAVGGSMWFDSDSESPESQLLIDVGAPPRAVHASSSPVLCIDDRIVSYTQDVHALAKQLGFANDAFNDYVRTWHRVREESEQLQDPSVREERARTLTTITASDWMGDVHPGVRDFYSRLMQAEMHLLLEEVSAFFFVFSLPPFGGGNNAWGDDLIRVPSTAEGKTLASALETQLSRPPVTGAIVTSVEDLGGHCLIRYQSRGERRQMSATKVVVTTPSSVVPRLVRGLPSWKLSALLAMRPSCVVGLHLIGDNKAEAPWDDLSFAWAIDKSFSMILRPADGGTLVRLAAVGSAAMFYADRSDDAVTSVFENDFLRLYPEGRDLVEDHLVTRFFHPATMPRFGVERNAMELMQRVGNVHFAGDYTGFPRRGEPYQGGWGEASCIGLHAAIRSGLRVADEIREGVVGSS